MTAKPGYEPPLLRDVQLMYVVFDVMIVNGQNMCARPLEVSCEWGSVR